MDSDFHYYGTGTAALNAGFKDEDAILIANVAQYVDWFDSNYWSYWKMVDKNGKPIEDAKKKQYEYRYPQLSVQEIGSKMVVDYDKDIWNAFHFPPGNLSYAQPKGGWEKDFHKKLNIRDTNLSTKEANKLCRPFSQFALDMINDMVDTYTQIKKQTTQVALDKYLNKKLGNRVRCCVSDKDTLALYLLGIRMHVLADTWAHQDFTGEINKSINFAGTLNYVKAKDANGKYQSTTWTGTAWVLHDDTDCAAAPAAGPAGHGQVGHYPDYSWMVFEYPAQWSKEKSVERNNPTEYDNAWKWLCFVMKQCLKSKDTGIGTTPREINDVMSTWHLLSERGLVVIEDSEKLWQQTTLGKKLPLRWNPEQRKELGLYDGFPLTRTGHINIVKDSVLHYMETAAALHYQFCYDWTHNGNGKNYTWKPQAPRT